MSSIKRDAADGGEDGAVIEHGRVADRSHNRPATTLATSCNKPDGRIVPADAAGAQPLRHKLRAIALPAVRNMPWYNP